MTDWPTEADIRELEEIDAFLEAGGSYARREGKHFRGAHAQEIRSIAEEGRG
jgi:hypothetical protein